MNILFFYTVNFMNYNIFSYLLISPYANNIYLKQFFIFFEIFYTYNQLRNLIVRSESNMYYKIKFQEVK